MAIWTHVAGQTKSQAPSPLAFVPALMHSVGPYYPKGGIRRIPTVLEKAAIRAGVRFRYSTKITHIRNKDRSVLGVETEQEEFIPATAVLSNSAALQTYLQLLDAPAPAFAKRLSALPLQSPGVCAYLAVRGRVRPPYLAFKLGERNQRCRLLIRASLFDSQVIDGYAPARLLAPMEYTEAERVGPTGQASYLDQLLEEDWWRKDLSDFRVLAKRTAQEWGNQYHLYANSMNPVMTRKFMRQGRVPHRCPHVRGLYLAGSSTHPGQWVSFCAISGILAADCLIEDLN
jgi:phytoene dehydrogenase-like protein